MQLWFCPLLAFLLGSIPFGLVIAKARGIDIRAHGSGNIGATNVLRVVGKKYGVTCLILDLLKGFIPVAIAVNLIRITGRDVTPHLAALDPLAMLLPASRQFFGQLMHVLTALAAVLGHTYSPWVGFKGGKGVATSAGVLFALLPPMAMLMLVVIWVVVFAISRYVSLASIVASLALPAIIHAGGRFHHLQNDLSLPTLWESGTWNKPLFGFSLLIAALVVWKHRTNLRRLREGTENRFTRKPRTADA